MSELYSDTTPEYIVIDMTDPFYAIGALYKDIATLKAELATERKEHIEDEAVYVACIAENAALVEAARVLIAALENEQYKTIPAKPWPEVAKPANKLSALLQSKGEI